MKTSSPPGRSTWAATCAPIAVASAFAGCTNLTGLDGTDQYGCKAPAGIRCESVSGTYHNALQNNLPSQRLRHDATARAREPAAAPDPQQRVVASATIAPPAVISAPRGADLASLRSQPKVLRLWVKPWEDSDRDLHDQSYVYVQIDAGQWLVDRAQRQVRDAYARLRPPSSTGMQRDTPSPAASVPGTASGVDGDPTALGMTPPAQSEGSGVPAQE
jgi:conjugal transfer pilus assembly protein TraV